MIRALLSRLTGDEDADDESGFLPSRLDASVLESHGFGTAEAERELDAIEEQAQVLESEQVQDPRE